MRVILIPDDTSSGRTFSLSTFQVRLIALLSLICFGALFAIASLSGLWAYNSSRQVSEQPVSAPRTVEETDKTTIQPIDEIQQLVAAPVPAPVEVTEPDTASVPTISTPALQHPQNPDNAPQAAAAPVAGSEPTALPISASQIHNTPEASAREPQRTFPGRLNQALNKVLAAAGRTPSETLSPDPALIRDLEKLRTQVSVQNHQLAVLRDSANETMNTLGMRVGSLQAHITRLNALGERLTQSAGLNDGEFDFGIEPAMGGAASSPPVDQTNVAATPISDSDLSGSMHEQLQRLEQQLQRSDNQLAVLESLLRGRRLKRQSQPGGWPTEAGFVSSNYGERQDPFTGAHSFHKGLDIAAEAGTIVKAAASGLVTHAGLKGDFGHVVEISHGSGYLTRYAHNSELLVKSGDFVVKGESIAAMGSSGRSTGSHLHFEVIENGQAVDPRKYLESQ